MKQFSIALLTLCLSLIGFFILASFGSADYIDGLVMTIGLIIVILLSVVKAHLRGWRNSNIDNCY